MMLNTLAYLVWITAAAALTPTATLAPTSTPLAPMTLHLQLRHEDGSPAVGVLAQVIQMTNPTRSNYVHDWVPRVAGQCQTDAAGRCALAFALIPPVTPMSSPRFTIPGFQFISRGEIGGEYASQAPVILEDSYLLAPEMMDAGQSFDLVLLPSHVAVEDNNPGGTPQYATPPVTPASGGLSWATPTPFPTPVRTRTPLPPVTAISSTPGTPQAATTPTATPCPTCGQATPPLGIEPGMFSLILIIAGLGLITAAGVILWRQRRK